MLMKNCFSDTVERKSPSVPECPSRTVEASSTMEPDKGALHFSQRMLLELFSQPQFLHLIFFVFSSFSRSFIHGANVSKVFMSSLRSA